MQLQMDGPFLVLPPAPVEQSVSAGILQVMIHEFMTLHYRLACGKETTAPWGSMVQHQSSLWDSTMWPSSVMVKDPSKMLLGDCRKVVGLWRQHQAEGGASETFRFNFYIDSEGLQPSIYQNLTSAVQLQVIPAGQSQGTLTGQSQGTPVGRTEGYPMGQRIIALETAQVVSPPMTTSVVGNPCEAAFTIPTEDQATREVTLQGRMQPIRVFLQPPPGPSAQPFS